MPRPMPRTLFALACAAIVLLAACSSGGPSIAVKREQLFSLGYGPAEDQLDLFQTDGNQDPPKTSIAMREGIFYISNGAGAKLVRYTSWGDPLSMIYNADLDSAPILLKPDTAGPQSGAAANGQSASGIGREAVSYPFRSIGAIAVDSNRPSTSRTGSRPRAGSRTRIRARSSTTSCCASTRTAAFIDYLGQEGVGRHALPLYPRDLPTASDECVSRVRDSGRDGSSTGSTTPASSSTRIKILRDDLPMPEKGLVSAFDTIVPDTSGRSLILKVDYYKSPAPPTAAQLLGRNSLRSRSSRACSGRRTRAVLGLPHRHPGRQVPR